MNTSPYANYGKARSGPTPQTQAIPGREADMLPNNAGGYGFALNDWERLERFLILGSVGGTYYVKQDVLTEENAAVVIRCIKENGVLAVKLAFDTNVNNRAPKTDQQLFVLALALQHGDTDTKRQVEVCAPFMLRTGTHLLHFVAMLDSLGGWNRTKRRIVSNWFTTRDAAELAFQMIKYQNRDGWTMRDVLRVAHPAPPTTEHNALFRWAAGKDVPSTALPFWVNAQRTLFADPNKTAVAGAVAMGLPREALPTEVLADPDTWRALLPQMPLNAILRNLGTMTTNGTFTDEASVLCVAEKLRNEKALRNARVHPFAVLLATLIYAQGAGVRGSKTWMPERRIVDALEDAYDLTFKTVEPTNKRILIGVDISTSMSQACVGSAIPASSAAAAVAITLARIEPNAVVVHFDTSVRKVIPVTSRTGIAQIQKQAGGGTDLSAPVRWASGDTSDRGSWLAFRMSRTAIAAPVHGEAKPFDAFVLLTDNETWAGAIHPSQALEHYRKTVNPKAKLICCSMAASHANIVDPLDTLSFGCAGLDANIPTLVSDFLRRGIS